MINYFLLPPTIRGTIARPLLFRACLLAQSSVQTRRYLSTAPKYVRTVPSYEESIALLNSLQSNRAVRASLADATEDKNKDAIPEMLEWFRKAGYEPADIAQRGLRCIHVAGSSGKGSVCAMVESILLQYQSQDQNPEKDSPGQKQLRKVGTYTSPHLVDVRERIRINGEPISKTLFLKHFSALWERLGQVAVNTGPESDIEIRPGYFRFLTILAFQIFMEEGVKSAIIECGIGGEYDSTNILPAEAVTTSVITKLEFDHVGMLGNSLQEIAWHKAGIIKSGVPVVMTLQRPEAVEVVHKRALEQDSELAIIERLPAIQSGDIALGLLGTFQKDNASLAVAATATHLLDIGINDDSIPSIDDLEADVVLPRQFIRGLEVVSWPGRCEVYKQGNLEWYLDGAHTEEGMEAVAAWFRSRMDEAYMEDDPPVATILIFNQDERDGSALLRTLLFNLADAESSGVNYSRVFNYATFCPNRAFPVPGDERKQDLSAQEALLKSYRNLDRNELSGVYSSVSEAVHVARRISENGKRRVMVLVTGSLHLVGAWMENVPERYRKHSAK